MVKNDRGFCRLGVEITPHSETSQKLDARLLDGRRGNSVLAETSCPSYLFGLGSRPKRTEKDGGGLVMKIRHGLLHRDTKFGYKEIRYPCVVYDFPLSCPICQSGIVPPNMNKLKIPLSSGVRPRS